MIASNEPSQFQTKGMRSANVKLIHNSTKLISKIRFCCFTNPVIQIPRHAGWNILSIRNVNWRFVTVVAEDAKSNRREEFFLFSDFFKSRLFHSAAAAPSKVDVKNEIASCRLHVSWTCPGTQEDQVCPLGSAGIGRDKKSNRRVTSTCKDGPSPSLPLDKSAIYQGMSPPPKVHHAHHLRARFTCRLFFFHRHKQAEITAPPACGRSQLGTPTTLYPKTVPLSQASHTVHPRNTSRANVAIMHLGKAH